MKTEFHDPEYDAERDEEFFHTRTVKQRETQAALFISVIRYRGICQITGVAGRIELNKTELDELIEELQEASDFIDMNPPRKKETK